MTPPSVVARLAAQAARMDAAMTGASAQLTAVVPSLSAGEATTILEAAVPITVKGPARFLEEVAAHLAAHPDAFASGDSQCPPVVLRLARVLHDAGYPVVRPGCARCGTIRDDLRQLRAEGRICGSCDARSRKGTCARCAATETTIVARRPEGGICNRCYRKDPAVVEPCGQCGRLRAPAVRRPDGGSLCVGCWKRPEHECVSCGTTAAAALITEEGAFCHLCYNRHRRPRRPCGRCGELKRIACNAVGDQPDLCDGCYRGPEAVCSRCGRTRPCQRVSAGEPICSTCYARHERPLVACARCRRDRPVMTYWPMGPVCQSCYTAIVRSPAECPRCRISQPLIARDEDSAGICGPCVGHDVDFTCRQCGRSGNPYGHGRCAFCVLGDRLDTLLAGPDGSVPAQLQPVVEAIGKVDAPFSAIRWINASPNALLLAQLAAKDQPISHELLDELPPSRNQRYIRQVLVHTGVLPERHEDLERLPGWLEHELVGKPTAHATLARPFLNWFLLRRARQRAAVRRYPASADRDLRRRVSVALEFLAWLDDHALSLDTLRQDHLDDWLAEGGSQRRYTVRYFLDWTASRRLTRELTVPLIPRQEPQDLLDEDDRWRLLQRCLTDDSMPLDTRAAGALTLLFGLPSGRLSNLTASHLKLGERHSYLLAGQRPVLLPPRLADLLRRLAEQPQPRPLLSQVHDPGPRLLFPGMVPGRPISPHAMTQKLSRHGITVRAARNGALAALAADLPAAILADLLGMHVNTAVRWVIYARRDWTDYLADRAAEHGKPQRNE